MTDPKTQDPGPKTPEAWPLADAERIAWDLIEQLKPVCEQVMLCGSIRRRRPEVGDIDIVVEPRLAATPGLFGGTPGGPPVCLVHQWAARLVEGGGARFVANGPQLIRLLVPMNAQGRPSLGVVADAIGVDLYVTDAPRFPTTAFLRTGSEAHNRTLAIAAQSRGMKLSVSGGRLIYAARDEALARDVDLGLPAGADQVHYEAAVYEALGLAPLAADRRDPGQGNWVRTFDERLAAGRTPNPEA